MDEEIQVLRIRFCLTSFVSNGSMTAIDPFEVPNTIESEDVEVKATFCKEVTTSPKK